jgi:hypothetical protein
MRPAPIRIAAVAAMSAILAACTEMQVTKITPASRACGTDTDVKGMRYYLSRPYVLVKRPILIKQRRELYLGHPDGAGITSDDAAQSRSSSSALSYHNATDMRIAPGDMRTADQEVSDAARSADGAPTSTGGGSAPPAGTDAPTIVSSVSRGIGSAGIPMSPQPPPEKPTGDHEVPDLGGDIQIVFLPDLDEQYAVHGCNAFAKQAYGLRFEEGWKLTGVNVEQDSTPVPLEFLNLINKAIQSARNVAETAINPAAKVSTPVPLSGLTDQSTPSIVARDPNAGMVLYERVTQTYLQPGLYRLSKPWETDGIPAAGTGLLAQLGLPTVDRRTTRIAKAENLSQVLPDDAR